MNRKIILYTLMCLFLSDLIGQDQTSGIKKRKKNTKTNEITRSEKNLKDSVFFRASDLGKIWEIDKVEDKITYNPDSMRQSSTYTKYIFSLNEFKEKGGDLNSKKNLKIYYKIENSNTKNSTPSDPSMPSPSGGFTYITHICKIAKIEVN